MQTQEPTRTLAFLFTDIEGSTELWERFPESMGRSLERHDEILRGAVEGAAGEVVKTTGDGLMAVFASARDGVRACLAPSSPSRTSHGTGPVRFASAWASTRARLPRAAATTTAPPSIGGPDHGRGPRRPGPALGRRGRPGRGRAAGRLDAPGPR